MKQCDITDGKRHLSKMILNLILSVLSLFLFAHQYICVLFLIQFENKISALILLCSICREVKNRNQIEIAHIT